MAHNAFPAAMLAMLIAAGAPLAHAQTICEDSWDDVSLFGVVGADADFDGQGKAVCVGNLGVEADDETTSIPGGVVVSDAISVCQQQACQHVATVHAGAYVLTTGGPICFFGLCPKAGVVADVETQKLKYRVWGLP